MMEGLADDDGALDLNCEAIGREKDDKDIEAPPISDEAGNVARVMGSREPSAIPHATSLESNSPKKSSSPHPG